MLKNKVEFKNIKESVYENPIATFDSWDKKTSTYKVRAICPNCYKTVPVEYFQYKNSLNESLDKEIISKANQEHVQCSHCNHVLSHKDSTSMHRFFDRNIIDEKSEDDLLISDSAIMNTSLIKRFNVYQNKVGQDKNVCLSVTALPIVSGDYAYKGVLSNRVISINYTFRKKHITKVTKIYNGREVASKKITGLGYTEDIVLKYLSSYIPVEAKIEIMEALGFNQEYKDFFLNSMQDLNDLCLMYKMKHLPLSYFILFKKDLTKLKMHYFYKDITINELKRIRKLQIETANKTHDALSATTTICSGDIIDHTKAFVEKLDTQIMFMRNTNALKMLINKDKRLSMDKILEALAATIYKDFSNLQYHSFEKENQYLIDFIKTLDDKTKLEIIKNPFSIYFMEFIPLFENIDIRRNFIESVDEIMFKALEKSDFEYVLIDNFESYAFKNRTQNKLFYTSRFDTAKRMNIDSIKENMGIIIDEKMMNHRLIMEIKAYVEKATSIVNDRYLSDDDLHQIDLHEYDTASFKSRLIMNISDSTNFIPDIVKHEELIAVDSKKILRKSLKDDGFDGLHDISLKMRSDIQRVTNNIQYNFRDDLPIQSKVKTSKGDFVFKVINNTTELTQLGYSAKNCVGGYNYKICDGRAIIVYLELEDDLITIEIDPSYPAIVQMFKTSNVPLDANDDKDIYEAISTFCSQNGIGLSKDKFVYYDIPAKYYVHASEDSVFSNGIVSFHRVADQNIESATEINHTNEDDDMTFTVIAQNDIPF